MNDLYIKAKAPSTGGDWVRPSEWLPLDVITSGSTKFSGLFAVYELEKNVNTIQITKTGVGTNTIFWGDGTSQVVTSDVLYTKVYDYNSIVSPILVDDAGLNYKMVVVNINMDNVTALYIDRNTTATVIGNTRTLNWLDIALDCSTMTSFIPSNQGLSNRLQRLLIYNVGAFINGSAFFVQMVSLRVLKFPFDKLQSTNQTFTNYLGNVRDENNLPLNLNLTINNGSGFNFMSLSQVTEIGNITAPLLNSFQQFFIQSSLKKIGSINVPSVSNLVNSFITCVNLRGTINITTSPLLTSINGVASGCILLDGLIISNCTNVTGTVNAVINCKSLKTLILNGLRVGIVLSGCQLSADALNDFFTSLGTAAGAQTLVVTGNPGAATCNTSIATGKGYTVTI